ncbi:MAG: hypothetical protein IPG12_03390 [Saprospiraceae bacterium]|nr:hypothetical protein [Saprospiraceae bacterium]
MKQILLFLIASINIAISQSIVLKPLETKMSKGTDEHLKDFKVLQLDVKSVADKIDAIKGNVKEFILRTPEKNLAAQLFEYNLLSPDIVRTTGGLKI